MQISKTIKNIYKDSICPNCQKDCITFMDKISLLDFRFERKCICCNGYIKLPAWHALLLIGEITAVMWIGIHFGFGGVKGVLFVALAALIIVGLQLPFVPIKN